MVGERVAVVDEVTARREVVAFIVQASGMQLAEIAALSVAVDPDLIVVRLVRGTRPRGSSCTR